MKNKKRKILHVIASLEGGGAERQLQLLVNNTDSDIYCIAILFVNKSSDQNVYNEGIELIYVPRGSKWNILSLWIKTFKAVKSYQPDILQLWLPEIVTIPAAIAGRFSGSYILSSARGSARGINSLILRSRTFLSFLQYIMSDRIVANFNPEQEPYLYRKLFCRKKGTVIPNAILVNSAKTSAVLSSLADKDSTFMLWTVGRFIPSKRLDILLDSFAELQNEGLDMTLVICGSGSAEQVGKLKNLARQYGLEEHVIFPGSREDWHYLAKDADLFVFPSTSEGMPNALFEAMVLGLPCIAANIPVIANMIKHKKHAWLVQPASQSSLTDGIREMYYSADMRNTLAKAGQSYAKSFSVEHMVHSYDLLYQQK